jgi:hypothetical protein
MRHLMICFCAQSFLRHRSAAFLAGKFDVETF